MGDPIQKGLICAMNGLLAIKRIIRRLSRAVHLVGAPIRIAEAWLLRNGAGCRVSYTVVL